MGRRILLAITLVPVLSSACSDEAPAESGFAVADSAGVQVVTTSSPAWEGDQSPWELSLQTEIGVVEGDEPYLLGDPVSAVLLPGGGVAVADAQSADVRFYDQSGVFVGRAGSRGDGPGEFQGFRWMDVCGGNLVAYDSRLRRLTTLTLDGDLVSTSPFETPEVGSPPYRARCLPDGTLLAVGWGDRSGTPTEEGIHFHTQRADLWKLTPGVDSALTIGSYISSERVVQLNSFGAGGSFPHPFSRSVVFSGTEDFIFVGGAERLQVEIRDLAGNLVRILRGPDAELPIDDAFMERYLSANLTGRDSADRATLERGDYPMPERYPAYSEILADELGFIWLERFTLPWDESRRWGVFDPDGVFLGHIVVPLNFRITDISATHVTGVAEDELGVARVRIYALSRGATG